MTRSSNSALSLRSLHLCVALSCYFVFIRGSSLLMIQKPRSTKCTKHTKERRRDAENDRGSAELGQFHVTSSRIFGRNHLRVLHQAFLVSHIQRARLSCPPLRHRPTQG